MINKLLYNISNEIYSMSHVMGIARYAVLPLTHWVYLLVSLTVHPILSGWYCWRSRIPKKCSLSVSIHQPDSPYCPDDTVGWARYPPNIYQVYLLVSLTGNSILSGWYHRISRILTEYSLTGHPIFLDGTVGSAKYGLNIQLVYLLIV